MRRQYLDIARSRLRSGGWTKLLAQTQVDNLQYDDGIALMERSIRIDLGFTDAHRLLGAAYLRGGDVANAFEHLQIADVQIPGHPRTQALLDRARSALGRAGDWLSLLHRARQSPHGVRPNHSQPDRQRCGVRRRIYFRFP